MALMKRSSLIAAALAAAVLPGCGSGGGTAGSPCDQVVCGTPPAAECIDAATLWVYDEAGRCEEGLCVYGYRDVACNGGCASSACADQDVRLTDHSGALPADERSTTDVRAADIDRDGDLDLLWANQPAEDGSPGGLAISLNRGDGTFDEGSFPGIDELDSWSFIFPADLSGDGAVDLVLSRPARTSPGVLLLLNDGSGGFLRRDDALPLISGETHGLMFGRVDGGDIDGDGDVDLLVPIAFDLEMTTDRPNVLLINSGSGTFTEDASGRLPALAASTDYTFSVAVGDVTGDGAPDIFLGEAENSQRLLVNDGRGFFADESGASPEGPPRLPGDRLRAYHCLMADLEGDGDLDIVVINDASTTTGDPVVMGNHVLTNDGEGFFTIAALPLTDEAHDSRGLDVADMNLDGNPDIVIGNDAATVAHGGTALEILLGDGSGGFAPMEGVPTFEKGFFGVAAGDYDRDGAPDLACAVAMPDGAGSLANVLLLSD
jgi:hypothetical protein